MEDTRRSRLSRVKDAKKARNVLPEDCRTFNLDDSKTLDVECFKAEDLRPELRGCLLDLLEDNMKTQYEESGSEGWSREEKELEMFSRDSRQIILRDGEELIAFSHFRFDMDYDVDVVYCYEIQINNNYHRKGIGRFLVSVLEALVRTFNLTKLVLTVFDSNARENVIQEKNHIYGKLRKKVGGGGQSHFNFFLYFLLFLTISY